MQVRIKIGPLQVDDFYDSFLPCKVEGLNLVVMRNFFIFIFIFPSNALHSSRYFYDDELYVNLEIWIFLLLFSFNIVMKK